MSWRDILWGEDNGMPGLIPWLGLLASIGLLYWLMSLLLSHT